MPAFLGVNAYNLSFGHYDYASDLMLNRVRNVLFITCLL